MRVNYHDVIFQKRGLNILVYDGQENEVISTMTIYYDSASDSLKLY